ncbi:uncharacterized protein LOC141886900 [Acropora palmata]|uniref:uncharacterized protein LOC141886900 n=1 Tax=Acropora palmata TaxID=6131 RepID=UPI003DA01CB2
MPDQELQEKLQLTHIWLLRHKTVCGFKAPSPLLKLQSFDIVNGIAIDAMHCVFLGVVKQLVGLWFNSKHSGEKWYCGSSVEKVDKRLLEIKPPSVITRIPRSIQHHVKFWKATEYRNWLFYYSLPCMRGVLDEEYYQYYTLFVSGIFLLSGRSISPEQMEMAGKCLMHFVEMFDAYYGKRYVLMNHHMLLHLKENVCDHGPLWCSSLFIFENWNGDIGNYFHGTQNIAHQIMTAVTSHQHLPELIDDMPQGEAKEMVLQLRGHSVRTNRTHLKDKFYAIGALKKGKPDMPFEDDLLLFLGIETVCEVKFFNRVQFGDAVFHSRKYKRVTRRNNFTVAYQQEEETRYGQIEIFFVVPHYPVVTSGAVIAPMSMSEHRVCEFNEFLGNTVHHIVSLKDPSKKRFDIVHLENIIDICLYMKFSDNEVGFAAHFPNHFEKD